MFNIKPVTVETSTKFDPPIIPPKVEVQFLDSSLWTPPSTPPFPPSDYSDEVDLRSFRPNFVVCGYVGTGSCSEGEVTSMRTAIETTLAEKILEFSMHGFKAGLWMNDLMRKLPKSISWKRAPKAYTDEPVFILIENVPGIGVCIRNDLTRYRVPVLDAGFVDQSLFFMKTAFRSLEGRPYSHVTREALMSGIRNWFANAHALNYYSIHGRFEHFVTGYTSYTFSLPGPFSEGIQRLYFNQNGVYIVGTPTMWTALSMCPSLLGENCKLQLGEREEEVAYARRLIL